MIAHLLKSILREQQNKNYGQMFDKILLGNKFSSALLFAAFIVLYAGTALIFASVMMTSTENGHNNTHACISDVKSFWDYISYSIFNFANVAEILMDTTYNRNCQFVHSVVILEKICGICIFVLFIAAAVSLAIRERRGMSVKIDYV